MVQIIMAVLLAAASPATAASPTETVKAAVQQVFAQPDSSAAKTPSVAERRAQIRKVTETLFDFDEMSQRSLGKAWTQAASALPNRSISRLNRAGPIWLTIVSSTQ